MENGEYRIEDAPNALIVPETWFEQRFREVSLYFFDPTATILVPEPVFVPRGDQLTTALVKGLLRGPGTELDRVSRSFIPPGLDYGVSVTVSDAGVADISLKGDVSPENSQAVDLMMAQFAWTLRQDPAVRAFQVTVGGQQIQLPGGVSEVSVEEGAAYDPTGFRSSSLLYGLRDGLLVSGTASGLDPVDGPLGQDREGIRSLAVNLDATRAAGVTDDGSAVVVAPVHAPGTEVRQEASGASDLLRPAWDFADRLWLVDRTPGGARISYVWHDRLTALQVSGITGRQVRGFLVSRDGSRLVAVVHRGRAGDAIMVSRIKHDDQGRVLGAERAQRLVWEGSGRLRIRDLAWRTTTSIAVLNLVGDQLAQVRALPLDGSPPAIGSLSTTLPGNIEGLVGSPAPSEDLYARTRSSLRDLSSSGSGLQNLESGTTALGYVG
nr:LpqB family beta-propeller domain-containing protein [Nocardioides panaciterrulae]